MRKKELFWGLVTFLPGMSGVRTGRTSGTGSARYCYTVWMRHLVMAAASSLPADPRVIAELGPGDSLGIGLAAMLTGAEKYYAFDVVAHASAERNLGVFDELLELLRTRADIPGDDEFPRVKPALEDYRFPRGVLDDARLARALAPERIARIRASLADTTVASSMIEYRAPWADAAVVQRESVDMIFSQAVLEHIDDLRAAWRAMHDWLRPGGFVSHQIDYKAHRTAREWNGHWAMSDLQWTLLRGRRPYLLNREPHSTQLAMLRESGLVLVCEKRVRSEPAVPRERLAARYRALSQDDLTTSGAFVQAIRPAAPAP